MRIGLYAPDSKIPNLALMKISAFHKQNHDSVEFYQPLFSKQYDIVYISKVFKQSTIKYLPMGPNIVYGGSGVNLSGKLIPEIEHIYPDYNLYKIEYAMGYISRGCINQCPFCVVPKKEGVLAFNAPLEEFWDRQSKVMLLDNAITDCQGIKRLEQAGIKPYRLMCYVLAGFHSSINQDLYRINLLDKYNIDPFVMRYRKTPMLNALAKWCNRPAIRHSCSFEEYLKQKKMEYWTI